MRLVLQRVRSACVTINKGERRQCGAGLMILVGITAADSGAVVSFMAEKAVNLRIFEDENGQMNRSLLDVGGECLIVSNFTLYANCRKGRRPSYMEAAHPDIANPLYQYFVDEIKRVSASKVITGEFGADMLVEILNDGPVTILLDSDEIMPKGKEPHA